jgi:hypothetical protein
MIKSRKIRLAGQAEKEESIQVIGGKASRKGTNRKSKT